MYPAISAILLGFIFICFRRSVGEFKHTLDEKWGVSKWIGGKQHYVCATTCLGGAFVSYGLATMVGLVMG
ncbi:MAG: hypothetical protein Q7P63_04585 [Verrucomicrobiota bacterium JB022]|nr:hypothetical protein [Verrucomicrobiota bacterium JB022]